MLSQTSKIPEHVSPEKFQRVHPLLPRLLKQNIAISPKAEIMKNFVKNRKKLINNPTALEIKQGYNIHFILQLYQLKALRVSIMSEEEIDLIDQKIWEILSK